MLPPSLARCPPSRLMVGLTSVDESVGRACDGICGDEVMGIWERDRHNVANEMTWSTSVSEKSKQNKDIVLGRGMEDLNYEDDERTWMSQICERSLSGQIGALDLLNSSMTQQIELGTSVYCHLNDTSVCYDTCQTANNPQTPPRSAMTSWKTVCPLIRDKASLEFSLIQMQTIQSFSSQANFVRNCGQSCLSTVHETSANRQDLQVLVNDKHAGAVNHILLNKTKNLQSL